VLTIKVFLLSILKNEIIESTKRRSMSNWERKNADMLADAISKHIRSHPDMVEDNELLAIVQEALDNASTTVTTSQSELNRHRAVVCAICRGSKIYECDVPEGWSKTCAFTFTKTTEFGGL
jgi:hypothetical protein